MKKSATPADCFSALLYGNSLARSMEVMLTSCRLSLVVGAVVAMVGCWGLGNYPVTWDGRYAKAVQELDAARNDLERFYALNDAAKSAFETDRIDEARKYAEEALRLAPGFRDDWNYGNAVHDGHMVLGRLAVLDGDLETAERELRLAGKTPGSPQLDTFGPNMSLAKDLLEQTRTSAVIEYFELCGKFWEMEDGRLERWSALVRGDEMPDFGANLLY